LFKRRHYDGEKRKKAKWGMISMCGEEGDKVREGLPGLEGSSVMHVEAHAKARGTNFRLFSRGSEGARWKQQ